MAEDAHVPAPAGRTTCELGFGARSTFQMTPDVFRSDQRRRELAPVWHELAMLCSMAATPATVRQTAGYRSTGVGIGCNWMLAPAGDRRVDADIVGFEPGV
jgi:hypothetical protein